MTFDWDTQDMISRTLLGMQRKGKFNMVTEAPSILMQIFPDMKPKKLKDHYLYWCRFYDREKERLS